MRKVNWGSFGTTNKTIKPKLTHTHTICSVYSFFHLLLLLLLWPLESIAAH